MSYPKKYRTRDGRDAEVWKQNKAEHDGDYVLIGAILTDGVWYSEEWTIDGESDYTYKKDRDLILPPPLAVDQVWRCTSHIDDHIIAKIDGPKPMYRHPGETLLHIWEVGRWEDEHTFISAPEPEGVLLHAEGGGASITVTDTDGLKIKTESTPGQEVKDEKQKFLDEAAEYFDENLSDREATIDRIIHVNDFSLGDEAEPEKEKERKEYEHPNFPIGTRIQTTYQFHSSQPEIYGTVTALSNIKSKRTQEICLQRKGVPWIPDDEEEALYDYPNDLKILNTTQWLNMSIEIKVENGKPVDIRRAN